MGLKKGGQQGLQRMVSVSGLDLEVSELEPGFELYSPPYVDGPWFWVNYDKILTYPIFYGRNPASLH